MKQDSAGRESIWRRLKISGGQKKYIVTLVIISLIGVFSIVLGNMLEPKEAGNGQTLAVDSSHEREKTVLPQSALAQEEGRLAEELAEVLECVQGVGRVMVKVTLASTTETAYVMENQSSVTKTSEALQSGGNRTTDEARQDDKLAMQSLSQGISQPVVIKESRPQAVGVIVVAEGARDLAVKEQITQAVQVFLDIPAHKVTVLPREQGEGK